MDEPRVPAWQLDRQLNLTLLRQSQRRINPRDLWGMTRLEEAAEFMAIPFGDDAFGVILSPEMFADLWYSGDVPLEKLQTARVTNWSDELQLLDINIRVAGLRLGVMDGVVLRSAWHKIQGLANLMVHDFQGVYPVPHSLLSPVG